MKIKETVKKAKDKVVDFYQDHKEGIVTGAIFGSGLAITGIACHITGQSKGVLKGYAAGLEDGERYGRQRGFGIGIDDAIMLVSDNTDMSNKEVLDLFDEHCGDYGFSNKKEN